MATEHCLRPGKDENTALSSSVVVEKLRFLTKIVDWSDDADMTSSVSFVSSVLPCSVSSVSLFVLLFLPKAPTGAHSRYNGRCWNSAFARLLNAAEALLADEYSTRADTPYGGRTRRLMVPYLEKSLVNSLLGVPNGKFFTKIMDLLLFGRC